MFCSEPWKGSEPPAMNFAWRSQTAFTRDVGWLLPPKLSRHAAYNCTQSRLNGFTPPAIDCSRAMPFYPHARYRGQSSSSELQPFGFPSTLVLLKTRFRVVVFYSLVKELGGLFDHRPRPPSSDLKALVGMRRLDSDFAVERKGFEPSTPGLQSRCSPS